MDDQDAPELDFEFHVKYCEYLCTCDILFFYKFAKISNKLISRSGGSCVLKLRRQTNCIGLGIPDDYYYLLNHFKMAFWLLLVRK